MLAVAAIVAANCTIAPYQPDPFDPSFRVPVGSGLETPAGHAAAPAPTNPRPQPTHALVLDEVLAAVTRHYPPYLSALLERDLASGRLRQAMGGFDTQAVAKLGNTVQGYYEATSLEALLEQPLGTGDTVYGGYRVSDGFLPDYDKRRTQDDGELVLGGRLPLLRDRSIDRARANVRQARIDVELADPVIARARVDFVRSAARTYYTWVAAGQRLGIARELLRLASDRVDAIRAAVERQFLAPIDVDDNQRLIAQRQVTVVRAERLLQQAALELSLFLRDGDDTPIVPDPQRLPSTLDAPTAWQPPSLAADTELAMRQRPELRRFQLAIARTETDRALAENQTLPELDIVVEASRSLGDGPYSDRTAEQLFVGGELKWPLQQRDARGRLEQATAQLSRLQLEAQFARDRVVNEIADVHSALQAAIGQIDAARQNAELADRLVGAEQRAYELGRSDLFRIQVREAQLAEAKGQQVDAVLDWYRAMADYRAALATDAVVAR
jgi:outer membrane protein TolC